MKLKIILPGLLLIVLGVGIYVYYDLYIRPDREARELIVQGNIISEREDKDSINQAINIYSKVAAKYPKSPLAVEAYFNIGRCYEKLSLYRLARLKYIYVVKNNRKDLTDELKRESFIRMAHIKALKNYSEEAISQLFNLLGTTFNTEFRSRVYSELGHTYLSRGDLKDAEKMFGIAITEHGNNEDALIGKARVLKRKGFDKEAFDLYDYFLKYHGAVSQYTADVKKSYKEQTYRSGLDRFRKGMYKEAIPFFERVLKNFPDDRYIENALYWIGECNFAQRNFTKAIEYFNITLNNGFYHKDQDARIKKGYAYFSSKKFDLAAREFQIYLHHYPNGIHAKIARNWKDMSTKELLYRIKKKKLPTVVKEPQKEELKETVKKEKDIKDDSGEELDMDEIEVDEDEELDFEEDEDDLDLEDDDEEIELDEEIYGRDMKGIYDRKIKLDNVAEL